MDTAQWPQEIVVKPMEEIIVPNTCSSATACSNIIAPNINNNNNNKGGSSTSLERKVRPQKDQALNCPRCNSTNTKFCYYNNYSLTQPRYFCKTCRRYWTEGGSLRNIPVGGGSRKNKRSSSSSTSSNSSCPNSASKKQISDHLLVTQSHFTTTQNPKILPHQGQDLNLGFPPAHHQDQFRSLSEFIQLPTIESTTKTSVTSTTNTTSNSNLSAMELLNGLTSSRGLMTPFMPMPVSDPNGHVYSSGGFGLQDFKPSLSFSLDGLGNGNGYGGLQGGVQQQENNNVGRLLFPFEDLKQQQETNADQNNNQNNSSDTTNEQTRDQQGDSTGYWSGMLGTTGGTW